MKDYLGKRSISNFGEINSNFKVGDKILTEFISPSSPNPQQTTHFSVWYKSEGFGDIITIIIIIFLIIILVLIIWNVVIRLIHKNQETSDLQIKL